MMKAISPLDLYAMSLFTLAISRKEREAPRTCAFNFFPRTDPSGFSAIKEHNADQVEKSRLKSPK